MNRKLKMKQKWRCTPNKDKLRRIQRNELKRLLRQEYEGILSIRTMIPTLLGICVGGFLAGGSTSPQFLHVDPNTGKPHVIKFYGNNHS